MNQNKTQVSNAYTEWAPDYDEYAEKFNMATRKVYPAFEVILRVIANGKKGLDLGCGTGTVTQIASKYAKEIIGIDLNDGMLKMALQKKTFGGKLSFMKGDITDRLDFPDGTFDFVISSLAMNHVRDIEPVIAEVSRVLKPDGVFIFDEPDSGPRTPEQLANKARPKVIDPLLKSRDKGTETWFLHPLSDVVKLLKSHDFTSVDTQEICYDDEIKDLMDNYEFHQGKPFFVLITAKK